MQKLQHDLETLESFTGDSLLSAVSRNELLGGNSVPCRHWLPRGTFFPHSLHLLHYVVSFLLEQPHTLLSLFDQGLGLFDLLPETAVLSENGLVLFLQGSELILEEFSFLFPLSISLCFLLFLALTKLQGVFLWLEMAKLILVCAFDVLLLLPQQLDLVFILFQFNFHLTYLFILRQELLVHAVHRNLVLLPFALHNCQFPG